MKTLRYPSAILFLLGVVMFFFVKAAEPQYLKYLSLLIVVVSTFVFVKSFDRE
ncbi:hypothetical protein GCM10023310_70830 [Paenibacillus vulneris]